MSKPHHRGIAGAWRLPDSTAWDHELQEIHQLEGRSGIASTPYW
jgi:hypothetical protein